MSKTRTDALYGVLAQGLISLSNLGIGALLIKLTTKESYGLYGIAFAAILLWVGFANALISSQMTVYLPEKKNKNNYCLRMLIAQYLLFIPLSLISGAVALGLNHYCIISESTMHFILIIVAAIMTAILHDFMRRYFYAALKPKYVLQIDVINIIVIYLCLILAIHYEINISHITAILIYSVGALCAGTSGLIRSKLIAIVRFNDVIQDLQEALGQGVWAFFGVLVAWLQSQGYVVMLTVLSTPTIIAEANAARLLLSPVNVISNSLGQTFIPRLAILRNDHKHAELNKLANKILSLILLIIIVIVFIVFLINGYLIDEFFPKDYSNIESLIILWSGVYISLAIRTNATILLQVYKRFKAITIYNFITAMATLLGSWPLIKINGAMGSLQASILGELFLALFLWRLARKQAMRHE